MALRILLLVLSAAILSGLLVARGAKPSHDLTVNETLSIIQREELNAGFERVRKEYKATPAFREKCHTFMLDLGEAAFKEFPEAETASYDPISVTCNYGFFQSYPHAMLLATKDVERVRAFCLRVGVNLVGKVPLAQAECFRGIGRALPFLDESLLGDPAAMAADATRTCDVIAARTPAVIGIESDHDLCVSGAFNMLGRKTAAGKYSLQFDPEKPFGVCDLQKDEDARLRCYGNFKWMLLGNLDLTKPAESFRVVERSDSSAAALGSAAWTIGYDSTRMYIGSNDFAKRSLETCRALPAQWSLECVRGSAIGIAKHGEPGRQHLQLISFCAEARQEGFDAAQCLYSQVIEYIKGFYSPDKFEAACSAFERNLGIGCARASRSPAT